VRAGQPLAVRRQLADLRMVEPDWAATLTADVVSSPQTLEPRYD
jgi:hypothetical protein